MRKKDASHIHELGKFLRSVKEFNKTDRIYNRQIRADLNIFAINESIDQHKETWKEHLYRIPETRLKRKWLSNINFRGEET